MKTFGLSVLDPGYKGAQVPVMEHIWGLSRQTIRHFTGIDPLAERARLNEAFRRIAEVFEIDLLWGGGLPDARTEIFDWDDGQKVKRNKDGGAVVQWGILSAAHQEDGRHFTDVPKPASVEEALAFQPLQYFPKSVAQYRDEFAQSYAEMLASTGATCYPIPHHYTTCFHWPLAIFGFELLCEAGMEEDRFSELMARFVEVSLRVTTAWSQVPGLNGFILHDDLTMSGGPIFAPDWYRRHIFIHYPAIFEPLRRRGIPIIFTSDGNCSAFVDDIFAAGADGLNFEYLVSLERLVRDYPDKILIGNINSATIANGPVAAIEREVRDCLAVGSRARRFVANVGGGLTHNAPIEHLEAYLKLRKQLCRSVRA